MSFNNAGGIDDVGLNPIYSDEPEAVTRTQSPSIAFLRELAPEVAKFIGYSESLELLKIAEDLERQERRAASSAMRPTHPL